MATSMMRWYRPPRADAPPKIKNQCVTRTARSARVAPLPAGLSGDRLACPPRAVLSRHVCYTRSGALTPLSFWCPRAFARRCCSSATLIGDRILVFGGFDGRRNHNSVHLLDCGTSARSAHKVTRWSLDLTPALCFVGLRCSYLDVEPAQPHQWHTTCRAQRAHSDAGGRRAAAGYRWLAWLRPTGSRRLPRASHTCVLACVGRALLHAAPLTVFVCMCPIMFAPAPATMTWRKPDIQGAPPGE